MGGNCNSWTKDNDTSKWDPKLTIPRMLAVYKVFPSPHQQVTDAYKQIGDKLRQAIAFKQTQVLFKNPNMDQNTATTAAILATGWANQFINTINDISASHNKSTGGKGTIPQDATDETSEVDVKGVDPKVFQSVLSFFLMADKTSLDNAVENSDLADGGDGGIGQATQ